MSNKDKCILLVNSFNESQLANILSILEAARNTINEAEDDAYCNYLYKEYLNDSDKGESISIDELSKQLGITL